MKLGNVYNLDSMKRMIDSASKIQDSYAGTILARHLTAINPRIFEKKYPELALMAAGIQANNIGGFAHKVKSLRLIEQGYFAEAGNAAGDKGHISLRGEDSDISVIEKATKAEWTMSEIKEAELGNVNLPARYLTAINRRYLREIDQAGLVGVKDNQGLLNTTAFTSTGAGGAIATLSAQEMYDVYAELLLNQKNAVNNTAEYMANKIITPTRCLNILQATMMDTTAGTASVLKALQDNFPGVDFVGSFRADDTAGGGDLTTSSTVAFSNNDEATVMRIPVPLQVGEVIKVGSFDYTMDAMYRVAGIDILESSSGRILTGL